MTTTLKKALALAMCLTMLVLAVPGFASGEATGPEANAAREMVNIRFSQYANSVDDQEGDRKSTRLNSSHNNQSRMPSSA